MYPCNTAESYALWPRPAMTPSMAPSDWALSYQLDIALPSALPPVPGTINPHVIPTLEMSSRQVGRVPLIRKAATRWPIPAPEMRMLMGTVTMA